MVVGLWGGECGCDGLWGECGNHGDVDCLYTREGVRFDRKRWRIYCVRAGNRSETRWWSLIGALPGGNVSTALVEVEATAVWTAMPLTRLHVGGRGRTETSLSRERLSDGARSIPMHPTSKYGVSRAVYGERSINYGDLEAYDDSSRVLFWAKIVTSSIVMSIVRYADSARVALSHVRIMHPFVHVGSTTMIIQF